jgi:two-component system sensor histidine kinase AtoS
MALSGIGELPLFKRRSTGAEEMDALLDLLPHATLIADSRNGRVLFANAQAALLTGYTRKEFLELDLKTLLPDFAAAVNGERSKGRTLTLVKRNSSSLSVVAKETSLGGPDHWIAVSLQPATEVEVDRAALEQQRWDAMHMLALAAQQPELASCFRQILQAGNLLTGAEHLLLYTQVNEGKLVLEAVLGSGVEFPAMLEEKDLGHLRTPKVWQTGKPIESPLHKVAHANKLAYIATTPLDLTQPQSGLLVAADGQNAPSKELLTLLQILAASAATAALNTEMLGGLQQNLSGLKENEELGETLQENVQDGLLFVGPGFNIVAINPAAELMLGYTAEEVRGRPANDVLISGQPLLPSLESALKEGKTLEVGERKLHRRDGSEFLAGVRMAPIRKDGKVQRIAVMLTDLSEHEAFHVRSQQLQQRAWLGEVTAIFAHEVRNPINNISTGLQLMQLNLPEQDPLQEQIKRLQEDCDRLEHRMKSVLSFSRNLEHKPEPLDIGEFCRGQLERWRPRMARKNIQEHLQVAINTPLVYGDRRALDQVFTNLITNAIQAMDEQENGFLAIKITPSPDNEHMVDIHISDNGPGIPEDLRKRVFEPFFTTKDQEGTGLGLAITRRIIMAHRGEIELESFPGGTLFKIQLPIAPAQTEGSS